MKPSGIFSPFAHERVNHETEHGDRDAGIGHVKGGPRMKDFWRVRSEIKQEKVNYVTVEKSISEVAENPGQQQRQGNIAPRVWFAFPHQQYQNNQQRDARDRDEKCIVVLKRTKGRAGVCIVHPLEELRFQLFVRIDVLQDEIFRPLIQGIEWKREEEDKFHTAFDAANAHRPTRNAQRPMQIVTLLNAETWKLNVER